MGGQVTGEYHRVSTFTFDDQGNRYEKISFFPMSSMPEIHHKGRHRGSWRDQAIRARALEDRPLQLQYVGKEKIDELNLYVFDVTPKVMPNPKKT